MSHKPEITQHNTITIVTSGYSDRYISTDTKYIMKLWTPKGQSTTFSFSNKDQMFEFLVGIRRYTYTNAYKLPIKQVYSTSGYIDNRRWGSRQLNLSELRSIKSYLDLYHSKDYHPDYLATANQWLEDNPLSADLLAIVKYQISECDRKNLVMWGHINGQEG